MWSRIYKYQAHGYAFSSVEELLDSLGGSGFINMTRRPLSDSLLELGVSQRFIDEVIAPVMRVNYGQNVSIPAFVGQTNKRFIKRRERRDAAVGKGRRNQGRTWTSWQM